MTDHTPSTDANAQGSMPLVLSPRADFHRLKSTILSAPYASEPLLDAVEEMLRAFPLGDFDKVWAQRERAEEVCERDAAGVTD